MVKVFLGAIIISSCLCFLSSGQSDFFLSEERPCPGTNVTFTCTVPLTSGSQITWRLPNGFQVSVAVREDTIGIVRDEFGYIISVTGLNSTSGTSTLTAVAEDGLTISCEELTGTEVGSITVQLASTPSPPQNVRHLVLAGAPVSVSMQWDPSTDNGGRDELTYTVSITPMADLSSSVVSTTSVTVYPEFGVRYTVSIVSTTCAGNSTASEYTFTVCSFPALVSVGAAVGITVALCLVFFLGAGILIGLLIACCWLRSKGLQLQFQSSSKKMTPAHVPLESEEIKDTQQ